MKRYLDNLLNNWLPWRLRARLRAEAEEHGKRLTKMLNAKNDEIAATNDRVADALKQFGRVRYERKHGSLAITVMLDAQQFMFGDEPSIWKYWSAQIGRMVEIEFATLNAQTLHRKLYEQEQLDLTRRYGTPFAERTK